jgi:hypothetical protein
MNHKREPAKKSGVMKQSAGTNGISKFKTSDAVSRYPVSVSEPSGRDPVSAATRLTIGLTVGDSHPRFGKGRVEAAQERP